jgi:hypothetical protein
MQRFKPGDAVFILPKFAHLYSSSSGTVRDARRDPFRSIFNEYAVEFADGSSANVFEFQLIEDSPDCKTLVADVVFDSREQLAKTGARGQASRVQVVFHAGGFDVDLKIQGQESIGRSMLGQVLETDASDLPKQVHVRLMQEGVSLATADTDDDGIFEFGQVPAGSLNILVGIPEHHVRIIGGFSL